ncbi:MAG: hypothetical protein RIC55_03485 [Pirellulaceae bacterium]
MKSTFRFRLVALSLTSCLLTVAATPAQASEPLVPGTGTILKQVGDDFEDPDWKYIFNNPKSTEDNDKSQRLPAGKSVNGRWYEGAKRGHPDIVERVETPPGGLEGSTGSLLLRSVRTGIPGRPSHRMQQDDFIGNVNYRVGGSIPVSRSPSVVVRVFFPPIDTWEERSGPTFAFRSAVTTHINKPSGNGFFRGSSYESETYYPGFFVELDSKKYNGRDYDSANFRIRASRGGDFKGPQITQTGWWTMGMSFTPDGQVHYFAKPGIEDLTAEDHVTSQFPYGYRCEHFSTFFFNVCSVDDGRTWSTPWIVDDPAVYVLR